MIGIGVLEGPEPCAGAGAGAGSVAATAGEGSCGLANAARNCDWTRTQINACKRYSIQFISNNNKLVSITNNLYNNYNT